MSPVFSPPVAYDVPRILPETRGVAYLLMRHYSPLPRGRSVLLVNGHYVIRDNPEQSLLDGLEEGTGFFLGGHVYTVDAEVAALLAADGFTTTPDPDVPPRRITWGALAGLTWDEFRDQYGTWA